MKFPRVATLFPSLLLMALASSPALASTSARTPTETEIYCSGIVSRLAPRQVGRVASGEEARDKLQFAQGDDVYLHLAARSGAPSKIKIGEQFLVVRAAKDPIHIPWFRGEKRLQKRMGRLWEDIGRIRVIRFAGNVAIARIESSCMPMQRGDRLVAFAPRPVPRLPLPASKIASAASIGQLAGRIVSAKDFRQILGSGYIAYVDLGARQGIKVGDRLVIFRRPGHEGMEVYRMGGAAPRLQGLSHSSGGHEPVQRPREVLGEAVVLRVSPTASTILVTSSRREIDLGDYAGLE